jgi:ABC-type phosphate/phosphonate transport system permease subunit
VPPSPAPRRFACQLATPWIAAIAVAFLADLTVVAWILAVPLLVVAATNATTNWCLPSLIYGLLHGQQRGEPAS